MNIADPKEFDDASNYYKYRTPYIPKIFETLSERLELRLRTH